MLLLSCLHNPYSLIMGIIPTSIFIFFVGATGEAHFDILYPGDATLFPRALLHFEINLGTKTASFISALNSENPGTLVCTKSLTNSPTQWCQLSSIQYLQQLCITFQPKFTKIQVFVTTAKNFCNIYNILIIYKTVSEKVLSEFVKK